MNAVVARTGTPVHETDVHTPNRGRETRARHTPPPQPPNPLPGQQISPGPGHPPTHTNVRSTGKVARWMGLLVGGLALVNLVGCAGWFGDPRDIRPNRVGFFREDDQIGLALESCGVLSLKAVQIYDARSEKLLWSWRGEFKLGAHSTVMLADLDTDGRSGPPPLARGPRLRVWLQPFDWFGHQYLTRSKVPEKESGRILRLGEMRTTKEFWTEARNSCPDAAG